MPPHNRQLPHRGYFLYGIAVDAKRQSPVLCPCQYLMSSADHFVTYYAFKHSDLIGFLPTAGLDAPLSDVVAAVQTMDDFNSDETGFLGDVVNNHDVPDFLRIAAGESPQAKAGSVTFQTFTPEAVQRVEQSMDAFYVFVKKNLQVLKVFHALRNRVEEDVRAARVDRNKRFPRTTEAFTEYTKSYGNSKKCERARKQLQAMLETTPLQ